MPLAPACLAEFAWPNGLAFSPDFSKLYMSNPAPEDVDLVWYVYDVEEDGGLANRRLFFDGHPMKEVCSATDMTTRVPTSQNKRLV